MIVRNRTSDYKSDEATMKRLKKKLIIANKILDRLKITSPFGHISARIPGTETFLITRNLSPGIVAMDDIVVCDLSGKVLEGKFHSTYAEVVTHTGVYKKRKEFGSVIHSHSPYVIALGTAGVTVLPTDIYSIVAGPEPIALFKKVVLFDKPELGEEAADLLGPNKAVFLKGHGALVVGKSIEDAVFVARNLETAAMLQWRARCVGKLTPLTEEEKQPLFEFYTWAADQPGMAVNREWAYYESQLKR